MEGIAQKYLSQLENRASASGLQIQFPKTLASQLAVQGKQSGGARRIRHLVQEKVEGPLAVFLLKCPQKPTKVKTKLENGKLEFSL